MIPSRIRPLLPILTLILLLLLFLSKAILSPYFEAGDLVSNTLPIVHYKLSLLRHTELPLYTSLWYGGRPQWQNPLWNFFYLPSTLIWLIFPYAWAARIVITLHVLAAGIAAHALTKRYLDRPLDQLCAAMLLLTPLLPGLGMGHLEKIFAWVWVMLGLRAALGWARTDLRDGLIVGACLSMMALAGANYYVFYSIILFGFLLLPRLTKSLIAGIFLASLPGFLIHLPSIIHTIGLFREPLAQWLSIPQVFTSHFIGIPGDPPIIEGFALIGAPTILLLAWSGHQWWTQREEAPEERKLFVVLLGAWAIFFGLATEILYYGHRYLDTFRVTGRALAFGALALILIAILYAPELRAKGTRYTNALTAILLASSLHAGILWLHLRPTGAPYWLNTPEIASLIDYLDESNAQNVWLSPDIVTVVIGVGLNDREIALPNWYYGAMGQRIEPTGDHCGYSFDHLITSHPPADSYPLTQGIWPNEQIATIDSSLLTLRRHFTLDTREYWLYEVTCNP